MDRTIDAVQWNFFERASSFRIFFDQTARVDVTNEKWLRKGWNEWKRLRKHLSQ